MGFITLNYGNLTDYYAVEKEWKRKVYAHM